MKELIISLAFGLAIAGCATSVESLLLARGDFVEAYARTVNGYYGQPSEERNRTRSEILSKTGGARATTFKGMLANYMESHSQDERYFSSFPEVLAQALKDGLINSAQHTELSDQLLYQVEKASIQSPSLLQSKSIRAAFPELGRHRAKIAQGEFTKLELDPKCESE